MRLLPISIIWTTDWIFEWCRNTCFDGVCSWSDRLEKLQQYIISHIIIIIWLYSPYRALASPIFLLQTSLSTAPSFQFLIPSNWWASFRTASSHLFFGLPWDLFPSNVCVCVCVFQCQPTALLRSSSSTQGGQLALSVVYFRITHRLGRPHYVWDEYLYSVWEKLEVGVIVSVTVCVLLLSCVGWWWKEGRRWNPVPAHSLLFSESTKGPPGLTSPSEGRIAINSTISLLNIHTAEGFGI